MLDPFCGSGTTLIAAEKTGRRGYGIEYEPKYVDGTIRRWQAYTGRNAVHAESGLTFEEMQDHRHGLLSSIGVGASPLCERVQS